MAGVPSNAPRLEDRLACNGPTLALNNPSSMLQQRFITDNIDNENAARVSRIHAMRHRFNSRSEAFSDTRKLHVSDTRCCNRAGKVAQEQTNP